MHNSEPLSGAVDPERAMPRLIPMIQTLDDFLPEGRRMMQQALPPGTMYQIREGILKPDAAPSLWDDVIVTTRCDGPPLVSRQFHIVFDASQATESLGELIADALHRDRDGLQVATDVRLTAQHQYRDGTVKHSVMLACETHRYATLEHVTQALWQLSEDHPAVAITPITARNGQHIDNPGIDGISGLCVPSATAVILLGEQQSDPMGNPTH